MPDRCLENKYDKLKYKPDDVIEYAEPKKDWETACNIVGGNEEVFRENTVFKLGELSTASSDYAHTLLGLIRQLDKHVKSERKEVLSFSIFGGPGSGKSFIARQIAAAVDIAGDKFEEKIFNLSQFKDEGQLLNAFEEIQSISLTDKTPFVLWDEFDTYFNKNRAGWLSSFLMPMQDAEFQDGKIRQKLGKCVFVFIGGTFKDDSDFNRWMKDDEGKRLKGPDFHSRLDRSLAAPSVDIRRSVEESIFNHSDISDISYADQLIMEEIVRKYKKDSNCLYFDVSIKDKDDLKERLKQIDLEGTEQIMRVFEKVLNNYSEKIFQISDPAKLVRAILIRSLLKKDKNVKKLNKISKKVLAYLLHVPLEHGVRSLKKIIDASELKNTKSFEIVHLPFKEVLQLHVDESQRDLKYQLKKFLDRIGAESIDGYLELKWEE